MNSHATTRANCLVIHCIVPLHNDCFSPVVISVAESPHGPIILRYSGRQDPRRAAALCEEAVNAPLVHPHGKQKRRLVYPTSGARDSEAHGLGDSDDSRRPSVYVYMQYLGCFCEWVYLGAALFAGPQNTFEINWVQRPAPAPGLQSCQGPKSAKREDVLAQATFSLCEACQLMSHATPPCECRTQAAADRKAAHDT